MRALATILLSAIVALGSVAGCVTTPEPEDEGLGKLQIPLRQDLGGSSYRLSAFFAIENDTFAQVIDGSGDDASLSVALPVGVYRLRLLDGWRLERSVNGALFQPITAQLGSPNPVDINILVGGQTFGGFDFLVPDPNGTGTLTISFGVAIVEGRILGTLNIASATGVLAPYVGTSPSFTISYANASRSLIPPAREILAFTNAVTFSGDPFGLLQAIAPSLSGGFFGYRVETLSTGDQLFSLGYNNRDAGIPGRPINSLSVFTNIISPPLAVDENGVPQDPALLQATVAGSFSLFATGVAPGEFMAGTVTLQFTP